MSGTGSLASVTDRACSHARTFYRYVVISTAALFLAVLSGAAIGLWERATLLPPYIYFFSFAAFSVMLFQSVLTRRPDQLPALDVRDQRGMLGAALAVSGLSVVSELALLPWLKIFAGLLLGGAVIYHGRCVWAGLRPRQIWQHIAYRYFITDMLFLLVAAIGLFALGCKETWPSFPLIPGFLRPATVFLGASFPLTLTFTGYLYRYARAGGGLSPAEERLFDGWYYVLVGGVLVFLVVILMNLRALMISMAILLALGVFTLNGLFASRLVRKSQSLGMLYAFVGMSALLATSSAGIALILSGTPTIPAGGNPILLSHVHLAVLGWVCISYWGALYTLWPMMVRLDRGETDWLPLDHVYPPGARRLAYLQLALAIVGIGLLLRSHFTGDVLLRRAAGLIYAAATLLPLQVLSRQWAADTRAAENVVN
jgi:hypothetical protein